MQSISTHSCSHCSMAQVCLPLGIDREDILQLEGIVKASASQQKGAVIVNQGELFSKVYAVKTGTLKSTRIDEQGKEHVIGFHLPGELIGLDGIYGEKYLSTVTSLDTSVLCEMDYNRLTELCSAIPALQRQLFRLFSRDIHELNVSQSEYADQSALQKVAGFLNNLSTRYDFRGYSATEFTLAMSRQDIASHLSLTPETVSRILKTLKNEKIVVISNRHIQDVNTRALREIIQCEAA